MLGIECIYIDKNATDEEIGTAFKPNTKAVFGETLANPALTVFDIERFADIAHKQNELVIYLFPIIEGSMRQRKHWKRIVRKKGKKCFAAYSNSVREDDQKAG
jgi:O-acetylhomoserine sulfhydrylase